MRANSTTCYGGETNPSLFLGQCDPAAGLRMLQREMQAVSARPVSSIGRHNGL